MKIFQFIALLLLSINGYGQSSIKQYLQPVGSIEEADKFAQSHPKLKPILRVINSQNDTSAIDRKLYLLKTGDIYSIGNSTYKIISDTVKYTFRASYIYLDGSILSINQIDSLRNLILKRYSAGTTFETLADDFTMDGNKKHGDLGVFSSGMMVKEFEQAIRSHTNGEVFIVDVPDHQWYYVAKKTVPDQATQEMTVLEVNGR